MKSDASQGQLKTKRRVQDVLVVDSDPRTGEAFRAGAAKAIAVRTAQTVEQASLEMKLQPADLVVVNMQINDNGGLELLARMRARFPQAETVAVSRVANSELCVTALRAGAADLLTGRVSVVDAKACLERATQRRMQREPLQARNQRLRVVCRQLNKARHEISQQVNLLCHDLVKAYQELAEQLNQTQVCGEFAASVGEEVEIECLMRRTMEWVLKKLGPVNAAVFLPDSERNYALAAYLNFDTDAESMLMEVVGQTIVPQTAEGNTALIIEGDRQILDLFGQEANMLVGRSWLASSAHYHNECLAVLVVFRAQGEPFDPSWPLILEAVGPVLADKIARSIRVYQRGMGGEGEEGMRDEMDGDSDDLAV